MALSPVNQRDLLIYNHQLSSFSYPTFTLPVILWVAQEAEERVDVKRDAAGVAEKRTLFTRARVVLYGSRKSISASPLSVACGYQIDARVPFTDQNSYHWRYSKCLSEDTHEIRFAGKNNLLLE